jgi:hypothetical protein
MEPTQAVDLVQEAADVLREQCAEGNKKGAYQYAGEYLVNRFDIDIAAVDGILREALDRLLKEAESREKQNEQREIDLLPCPDVPGVMVDPWGVPSIDGVKLRLELKFHRKAGRKRSTLIQRYRLTVNGLRKAYFPKYFLIARAIAELKRGTPTPNEKRKCDGCNRMFEPSRRSHQVFCSHRCRTRAYRARGLQVEEK